MDKIVDCGSLTLHAPKNSDLQPLEYTEVIPFVEEIRDPSKTGPQPKRLVAVEVMGYEVGRGLRKKVVSPEDVYKLATLGMSNREIARWFDIDHQVVNYNFQTIIDKGREDMKTSLRRAMLKNALSGNAALQIFLAKNLLGMSDTPNHAEDKRPLPWTDDE